MKLENLFFVAAGLFSVAGAAFKWNFFMKSGKAKSLVSFIGVTGARIFYVAIGVILIGLGIFLTLS